MHMLIIYMLLKRINIRRPFCVVTIRSRHQSPYCVHAIYRERPNFNSTLCDYIKIYLAQNTLGLGNGIKITQPLTHNIMLMHIIYMLINNIRTMSSFQSYPSSSSLGSFHLKMSTLTLTILQNSFQN